VTWAHCQSMTLCGVDIGVTENCRGDSDLSPRRCRMPCVEALKTSGSHPLCGDLELTPSQRLGSAKAPFRAWPVHARDILEASLSCAGVLWPAALHHSCSSVRRAWGLATFPLQGHVSLTYAIGTACSAGSDRTACALGRSCGLPIAEKWGLLVGGDPWLLMRPSWCCAEDPPSPLGRR
jgi:hypothetical protein